MCGDHRGKETALAKPGPECVRKEHNCAAPSVGFPTQDEIIGTGRRRDLWIFSLPGITAAEQVMRTSSAILAFGISDSAPVGAESGVVHQAVNGAVTLAQSGASPAGFKPD